MANTGVKHDAKKLRYDLIPPEALEALVHVYTIGAAKYGDNNYLGGMNWSRLYASAMRHLQAFWQGTSVDPEDGQHPLASLAWCAFSLMAFENRGLGTDDRPWMDEIDLDGGLDASEGAPSAALAEAEIERRTHSSTDRKGAS